MAKKKLIEKKNKSLINVPYYDLFSQDIKRRDRYFKRYPKKYNIKKIVKKKLYSNYLGRKDKNVSFILELDGFFLLNNIYCVINLFSLKKLIIKNYPSIEKVLKRNIKESNKKTPALLVAMNFKIQLGQYNNENEKQCSFYIGSKNEVFTSLDEFCAYFEKFLRKWYIDKQYEKFFEGMKIDLIYRYAKKNKK